MNATDELIAKILAREGGVADVGDGKGVTRWGQTPGWLVQFNLPIPTNPVEAAENYLAWLRITHLDRVIGETADVLADAVIDWAVHAGHVTPIKALQKALGVSADGVIGPATTAALARMDRRRMATALIAERAEMLGRLISGKHTNAAYAHGWMRRLAEHIRALA